LAKGRGTAKLNCFVGVNFNWPFGGARLRDKISAAFVTAGEMSAGKDLVQMNILHSMLIQRTQSSA
jgi:hypothetical protein